MTLNLVQHRSGPNVWERQETAEWDTERWLLAMVAGGFVFAGLRRRSLPGMLLVVGGSTLGWWAATGIEQRRERRRLVRESLGRARVDMVGEASEESFPASDSPSWTPTTGSASAQHDQVKH